MRRALLDLADQSFHNVKWGAVSKFTNTHGQTNSLVQESILVYIILPAVSTVSVWPAFAVRVHTSCLMIDKQSHMPHTCTQPHSQALAQLFVLAVGESLVHFPFTLPGKWEQGYLIRTGKTQSTELAMLAHTGAVQGWRDNQEYVSTCA